MPPTETTYRSEFFECAVALAERTIQFEGGIREVHIFAAAIDASNTVVTVTVDFFIDDSIMPVRFTFRTDIRLRLFAKGDNTFHTMRMRVSGANANGRIQVVWGELGVGS